MPDIYEIQVAGDDHLLRVKEQLLELVQRSGSCSFLDSYGYRHTYGRYAWVWARGAVDSLEHADRLNPEALATFLRQHEGCWVMGHLAFEALHPQDLPPQIPDSSGFAKADFFVPEVVVYQATGKSAITVVMQQPGGSARQWWGAHLTNTTQSPVKDSANTSPIHFKGNSPEAYKAAVAALRRHIGRGDCYEINYCMRFEALVPNLDTIALYRQLQAASPNPFSAYYKQGQSHLLCASPERFMCGSPAELISQPMKGTAPRHLNDAAMDAQVAHNLQANPKERSENIMVVDLVRNDLSQVCQPGTVTVTELCRVYPFPKVHQMISTVTGTPTPGTTLAHWLAATFPMGSMTGAPKKRVLELIAQYETHQRGIFSGCVGYVDSEGYFDFNVVIRSLIYNAANSQLVYWAGSGITWNSQPQNEYEECMLKAATIQEICAG